MTTKTHNPVVKTEHVYPPIPIRTFDWMAYDDSRYCGCGECHNIVGHGTTEQEALADFWQQLEEQ